MVVDGDFLVVVFRYQGEQAFHVHGSGLGLVEVKIVKALLEERGDNLVFLHKECGLGDKHEFHAACLILVQK